MKMDVTKLKLAEVELLIERLGRMGLRTRIERLGENLSLVADASRLPAFEVRIDLDPISF